MRTEIGEVQIAVPRDRAGTFEPQIVPKHRRRLAGFDEAVISLYSKGMTTGDIAAHLSQVYDTDVSRDLVWRVTDHVLADMKSWSSRPLDAIYPVILIVPRQAGGAPSHRGVKVREGTVANRPVYVAIGIDLNGFRDVLGLWVGHRAGRSKAVDEHAV